MPGVIIGHNQRIAWGMTNLGYDVQDLYVEKFDSTGARYAYQGSAEPFPRGSRDYFGAREHLRSD
jgi:penicillin amidase